MSQLAEEAVFPVTQRALPARAPSHGTVSRYSTKMRATDWLLGSIRVSRVVFGVLAELRFRRDAGNWTRGRVRSPTL